MGNESFSEYCKQFEQIPINTNSGNFFLGVSHLNTFVCYLLSFGGAFLDFLQAVNVYIYANEFSVV